MSDPYKSAYWAKEADISINSNDDYLKNILKKLEIISAQMASEEEIKLEEDKRICDEISKILDMYHEQNIMLLHYRIFRVNTLSNDRHHWDTASDLNEAYRRAAKYQKKEKPHFVFIVEES